ncbi:PQQ-binding-like beta-propeller repeat protein [Halorussus sp. GCM10023401]
MLQRDPGYAGAAPSARGPTGNAAVAWTFETDEDPYRGFLPLAVADGTLFAQSRHTLWAVDVADGAERWRFAPPSLGGSGGQFLRSAPAVGDGTVFVVGDVSLYAVDAGTGRAKWKYRTTSSFDDVLLAGNTAFFVCRSGADQSLVALDAETGLTRWRRPADGSAYPLAYGDGSVFGATWRGPDDAADGETGLWEVYAVDARTGEKRWSRRVTARAETWFPTMAVAGGRIYVGTGPLYALDAKDGTVRWSALDDADLTSASPVTDGETVYVDADEPTRIVALDAADGRRRWGERVSAGYALGHPSLVGDVLYVPLASHDAGPGGVVGFDTTTGAERFRFVPPWSRAHGTSPPVVVDGTLYLGVGRTVYALEGDR